MKLFLTWSVFDEALTETLWHTFFDSQCVYVYAVWHKKAIVL